MVISQDLRLVHCQCFRQDKGENILEAQYNIIDEYADRGFVVVIKYSNCERNPLKGPLKKDKKVVLVTQIYTYLPSSRATDL